MFNNFDKLFGKRIDKSNIFSNKKWFIDIIEDWEHEQRINRVIDVKKYLARQHKILNRPDMRYEDEHGKKVMETAKIVLNSIRAVVDFHTSYCVGNPIVITGDEVLQKDLKNIYKYGSYTKTDMLLASDLVKFGDAFEYVFIDGKTKKIKSKVIANEDSYPIYDDGYNYIAFVEHYPDSMGNKFYIVYYPDKVEEYKNEKFISERPNLTGLPIHYSYIDKTLYTQWGDGLMFDLIPLMDKIEFLLSKMDDSITNLSLNPVAVSKGKRIDGHVNKNATSTVINIEEDGDYGYASSNLDYQSIKLELEHLINQFYINASIPASVIGQSQINNVSETSLKLLFYQTDTKANKMAQTLKEGMLTRLEYFRKLRALQGVIFPDDKFDSLDILFNYSRPINNSDLMNDLKIQWETGSISRQTIIDNSPYTPDKAEEIKRIEKEKAANPANTTDQVLATDNNKNKNNMEENK